MAAEKLTTEVRSKQTTKILDPYLVLSATYHTLTIDEGGVRNKVSTERVKMAPEDPARGIAGATGEQEPLSESPGFAPQPGKEQH